MCAAANRLPLGAAALAGTSYPLDRERVAKTLGMVDDKASRRCARTAWTP
jgi:argininosuccinate lyase